MILLLALLACGDADCPDGDLLASPGGLALTEEEHPTGWGNADCTSCHAIAAIHRISCSEGVDLAEVRAAVDAEGVASCASCHGENGLDTGVVLYSRVAP